LHLEDVDQTVANSDDGENRSRQSPGPLFELDELLECLADPLGAQGDQHRKDEHGDTGSSPVGRGQQHAGTILDGERKQAAEKQGSGNRTKRQSKENPKQAAAPVSGSSKTLPGLVADTRRGEIDAHESQKDDPDRNQDRPEELVHIRGEPERQVRDSEYAGDQKGGQYRIGRTPPQG